MSVERERDERRRVTGTRGVTTVLTLEGDNGACKGADVLLSVIQYQMITVVFRSMKSTRPSEATAFIPTDWHNGDKEGNRWIVLFPLKRGQSARIQALFIHSLSLY